MKSTFIKSSLLLFIIIQSSWIYSQNLLSNGSFENGFGSCGNTFGSPCSPSTSCVFCASNEQPTGWSWSQGNFDIYQKNVSGSDFFNGVPNGNFAVDLNGNAPGGLKQTINGLTVGQSYSVSFRYGQNNDAGAVCANRDKPLRLNVYNSSNTVIFNQTFSTLAFNARGNVWGTASINFTATTTSHTIEFVSLYTDIANCGCCGSFTFFGPALDDVVMLANTPVENCTNGLDDDGDGNIDTGDDDCGATTCSGSVGSPIVNVTFGTGTYNPGANNPTLASVQPGASTTYNLVPAGDDWSTNQFFLDGGQYAIRHLTGRSNNEYGNGLTSRFNRGEDNTSGDVNGRSMLVNGATNNNIFYRQTITGLCPNTRYQFSFWAANINDNPAPNIQARIETAGGGTVLAARTSGPLPQAVGPNFLPIWVQTQFSFVTQAGQTSLDLVLFNFQTSAGGNDLAIDDITFRLCGSAVSAALVSASVCSGSSSNINGTIGTGFTNPVWQWQTSTDGGANWTNIGTSGSGTSASLNVPAPINGHQYRLLASEAGNLSNSNCRVISNAVTLIVNANPSTNITGNTSICSGTSTTLMANGTAGSGTISNYAWSNSQSGATQTSISVNAAGTYVVTVTNTNGCSATANMTVTVNVLPTPSIVGTNTICFGQSTTLTASGGTSYLWGTGATTASITVSPVTNTTFVVTATNSSGCTATGNRSVTVNSLPTPSISGSITICQGQSTSLNALGGNSYVWDTGATTSTITVTPTNTTTYTVTATSPTGCTAMATRTVTVNLLPTPTISGANTICAGQSTTLTASGGDNYLWSTGATTAAITVTPGGASNYIVTATSTAGCSASTSRAVTVNANPTVSISGSSTFCPGTSTTLTANATAGSGTIANYAWSNGQSGVSRTGISVNLTGTYAVTTTNSNACSATASLAVNVVTCTEVCTDGIDNDGDNLVDEYDLDCNGTCLVGINNGFEQPSLIPGGAGSPFNISLLPGWSTSAADQQVELWTSGFNGVPAFEGNQFAELNAYVPSTFSKGFYSLAGAFAKVSFAHRGRDGVDVMAVEIGPVGGPYTSLGNFSDGNTAWGYYTINYTIPSTGPYNLRFVSVSAAGGNLAVGNFLDAVTVDIGSPNANFTAPTNICITSPITITDTSNAGNGTISGYSWNFGSGATPSTANTFGPHNVSYATSGTKTIVLTVSNTNGCTATANRAVTVNANPTVNISGSSSICAGASTTLTANATAGSGTISNYAWSNGLSGATQTSITVSSAGTFVVTVSNSNNCTATANNAVTQHAIVETWINPSRIELTCAANSATLTAVNSSYGFAWSTGATGISIPVNVTGTYSVTATSVNGCTGTASALVTRAVNPTLSANGMNICEGGTLSLSASGSLGSNDIVANGSFTEGNIGFNSDLRFSPNVSYGHYVIASSTTAYWGFSPFSARSAPNMMVIDGNSFLNNQRVWYVSSNVEPNTTYTLSVWVRHSAPGAVLAWNVNGVQQGTSTPTSNAWQNITATWNSGASTTGIFALVQVNSGGGGYDYAIDDVQIQRNGSFFAWSGPSGFSSTLISPTINNAVVGQSGVYMVTSTNENGCTASASVGIQVNANPTVNITGSTSICAGASTSLTANATAGSGSISNYAWSNGSSGSGQASITVGAASTYIVTVTNSNTCTATANRSVTVNANPTVNITGSSSICAGANSMLTANATAGSGTISNYVWSNGSSGAGQASITVGVASTYIVTVTNSNTCTATANRSVTQLALVQTWINPGRVELTCAANSALLTAVNSGYGFAWSNGTNGASISVNATGTYSVTATSVDGCTGTASALVTQAQGPTLTASGSNICEGSSLNLSATGSLGSNDVVANGSFSDGNIGFNSDLRFSPNVSYGHYVIASSTTAYWGFSPFSARSAPNMMVIDGNSFLNNQRVWYVSSNVEPNTTYTLSVWVRHAGGGAVLAWNVNGAQQGTSTLTSNAWQNITATWNSGASTTGVFALVQANSSTSGNDYAIDDIQILRNGNFFAWSGPSGFSSTLISPTISSAIVAQSGIYMVTSTNAYGCTTSGSVGIQVNAKPSVGITGNSTVCVGESSALTANATAGSGALSNYAWSSGQSGAAQTSINTGAVGTYSVTVTDSNGCTGSSNTINVAHLQKPDMTLSITGIQLFRTSLDVDFVVSNLSGNTSASSGIPVSFYKGDPTLVNAILLGQFIIPQSFAPAQSRPYRTNIDLSGLPVMPFELFAVVSDDGNTPRPFDLQITRVALNNADECIFSNNKSSYSSLVPLPIELLEFRAEQLNDKSFNFIWKTASERENQGFYLELARGNAAANNFTPMAFVAGQGNSQTLTSYSHVLSDLQPGQYYARLRQVDFSGAYSYSGIISFKVLGAAPLVYPTIIGVNGKVNIVLPTEGDWNVGLYDAEGRLLQTEQWLLEDGESVTESMFIEGLVPGFYYMLIEERNTGARWTEKLVMTKE